MTTIPKQRTTFITTVAATTMLLLLGASFALPAEAAYRNTTHFRGESADAFWLFEQDEVYTEVWVFATEYAIKQASSKSTISEAYINVYQYTIDGEICDEYGCYPNYVPILAFFGYATLDPGNFQVGKRLKSATLSDTTIEGFDYVSETPKTITLNVNWEGTGGLQSERSSFHYRTNDYNIIVHYSASYRQAGATGSISGEIDLNLDSSNYASIYNAKSGFIEIIKQQ